ncbi:MAG: hypothetical protein ABSB94_14520 [Syntrophorhabdales bacterium]|jgi:hypothetical protein
MRERNNRSIEVKHTKTRGTLFTSSEYQRGTVLIGFGEALSAPEVAWNLLDGGFRVVAFTRKGRRAIVRRMGYLEIVEITAPEEDISEALDQLKAIVERVGADTVMPLDDVSVWLCNEVSSSFPIPIAGPTGLHCALALDKRLQLKVAMEAGFKVITTRCVEHTEAAMETTSFPVVLKSALAVSRIDNKLRRGQMHFCANIKELGVAVKAWGGNGPMLVQPILSGIGEGLFGLAVRGTVYNWSAHRRIRMMNPQGSGSSACQSLPLDSQPVQVAEKMLNNISWHGLFMIELLRDSSGQTWFMELNGRSWGSMALALRRGFEYPVWAVMQTIDASFRPPPAPVDKSIICRHLGREIVHVLMILRGRKPPAQAPSRSKLRMLLEVFSITRGDCWYNWRNGHRLLFLEDAAETVLGTVLRRNRIS